MLTERLLAVADNAWLNHDLTAAAETKPHWLERVVLASTGHPALQTAVAELQTALPGVAVAEHTTATTDVTALAQFVDRAVVPNPGNVVL